MSTEQSNLVTIGEFGAPHGLQGAIKVFSSTSPLDVIFSYLPWLVQINGQWQPLNIETKQNQKNFFLVKIKGYDDCDQVRALTGKEIVIKREELPPLKDSYYWTDLIGLTVMNQKNITLGQVSFLFTSGGADILVVDGKKRYMMPFLWNQYIISVDLEKKLIMVDWDEEF